MAATGWRLGDGRPRARHHDPGDDGGVDRHLPFGRPPTLSAALARYQPSGEREQADTSRLLQLIATTTDPWSRSQPLHVTASAIVVDVASARVLLRWHERFGRFQQVGGHGDPGESDPLAVALREAVEETGLRDLRPVERAGRLAAGDLIHVAVVPVPARDGEEAHEHADLRYLLETDDPEDARAETSTAPVRWMSWDEALDLAVEDNQRELLGRSRALLS
jgi:8-oxo-dGTP pyrophosphatase MutT (NUDIX family)